MSNSISSSADDIQTILLKRLKAATDSIREDVNIEHSPGVFVRDVTAEDGRFFGGRKESTAWDVYNNEARLVDNEMVKDWKESLNSLLLFTAIFAAVLAAFIIESKKMLEEDRMELLLNATIFSLNRKGNETYTVTPFEPTTTAISINCFLFASLGVTLMAALASVVALQWVTDYDSAMTRGGSSPEDHAKRRQFRFAGVIRWRMGEIIASLPLLLYSSVALFAAGAILWMLSIRPVVGYVLSGLTAIAILFYVLTTLLAAMFASVPYRTQLSRGLYWLSRVAIQRSIRSIRILALMLSFVVLRAYSTITLAISFFIPAMRSAQSQNEVLFQQIRFKTLLRFSKTISLQEQERQEAKRNPWLREQALAWLERQLPRSIDGHKRLFLLLKELINHFENHMLSPQLFEISWWGLLDSLGWHYMQLILSSRLKKGDYEGLEALIRCSRVPALSAMLAPNEISPGVPYENNPESRRYWEQCCLDTKDISKAKPQSLTFVNIAFLLTRDMPALSPGSKIEMRPVIRLIKWRNSTEQKGLDVWRDVFTDSEQYSTTFRESCLRQFSRVVVGMSHRTTDAGIVSTGVTVAAFLVLGPPRTIRPDVASIFSIIIKWALSHVFSREESSALAHAFESWITQQPSDYTEGSLPQNIIRRPLQYGRFIRSSVGEEVKDMHYGILVLVARSVISLPKPDQAQWVKWILMMLWLASPGPEIYWDSIVRESNDGESTSAVDLWQRTDCRFWINSADTIPHIEEIVQVIGCIIGESEDANLIWVGSTEVGERRCQLVRIVEAFDRIIRSDSAPELHLSLIRLMSKDMDRLEGHWISTKLCEGHIRQFLIGNAEAR